MRKIILHLIKKIYYTRYTLHAIRYTLYAIFFILIGCGGTERKFPDIVWPQPPEEPRIKFVETYQSNLDVQEESALANLLVGEEVRYVLRKPYGVAADEEGRVYVSDIGKIFVFDKKNKKLSFLGDEPGSVNLRIPIGIAISRDGNVYVADTANDKIFVYNKNGKYLTTIGAVGEFESPGGLAVDDKRQRLYVVDSKRHNVKAFSLPDGKLLSTIGKRGKAEEGFNFPTNIALDSNGNLYVVDTQNFMVKLFTPDGKLLRTFGQIGDRLGNFVRPKGIAVDSEDNVYIVDAAFNNFQIFNKEGKLLLFVGDGGTYYGQFFSPAGMAIDKEDRIYVVDQLNRRVQVFQYLGEKWKKKQAAEQQKK